MELTYFYKAEMPNLKKQTLVYLSSIFHGFGTEPFRPL